MNLNELRDKAYKCAVTHGWHEEEYSNEHFLCLVISELMEAVEADRKGIESMTVRFNKDMDYLIHELNLYGEKYDKAFIEIFNRYIKDSVEDELADACIRLFDFAGVKEFDLEDLDYDGSGTEDYFELTFTESMFCIVRCLYEFSSNNIDSMLNEVFAFCRSRNIDIFWFIEQKMKYNELRPYKHGDKNY